MILKNSYNMGQVTHEQSNTPTITSKQTLEIWAHDIFHTQALEGSENASPHSQNDDNVKCPGH
jgi:hypothetical protein